MKIFCTINPLAQKAKALLEQTAEFTEAQPEADALLVQLGFTVDRACIDTSPNLKVIATATTGLDHIDTTYAKEKGIRIISLKDETEFLRSITSTAELALGLMIALARHIPSAHASVLSGNWNREKFRGHSLSGKTLGIVGMGRLGTLMATYGKGLGMNVIFTDPDVEGGVDPKTLLRESDIVSVHVHLQEDTENMFCKPAIDTMKQGALLINTARGKIVDEAAVIEALDTGRLGGYATDVLADELAFEDGNARSELIAYAKTHDNVIITPHIGGTTEESREATDVFIAEKLSGALQSL